MFIFICHYLCAVKKKLVMYNIVLTLFFSVAILLSLQQDNLFLTELVFAAIIVMGTILLHSLSPSPTQVNQRPQKRKNKRYVQKEGAQAAARSTEGHLA